MHQARGENFTGIARRLALALVLALGVMVALQAECNAGVQVRFPQPASLTPRVRFWRAVFARYSMRDFIVHDREQPWRVYGVYHLPGTGSPSATQVAETERLLEQKYSAILKRLASGARPATAAERQVAAEFGAKSDKAYAQAAANVRVQQGLREHFHLGLLRSRHYLPMMKRVFQHIGVPTGLIALAAVESQFSRRARSSAGALGIWQFTRPTALRFMHVSRHRDDRLSPYRSTVAAAKLLLENYQKLGHWPLAITAYNYGAGATARAVKQCGAGIVRIIRDYEGPGFGFAVQNYYAEFLAALELYRQFGEFSPDEGGAPIDDDDSAPVLARYRVRRGDTLSAIAARFDVSVAGLIDANEVADPRAIHPGLRLIIPAQGRIVEAAYRTDEPVVRYRVRRGDTLYRIARVYHVSAAGLMRANHLRAPRLLRTGTLLRIPAANDRARQRYTVRRGDTLYAIGRRYGVSADSLSEANSLDDARELRAGTVITIPTPPGA